MDILITHALAPRLGGSYLYTEELTNALRKNHNVVTINENIIDHNFNYEINTIEQIREMNFDIIIIMQAKHFINLDIQIKKSRVINVIHSEIYDLDDPLINNRVVYVAVRNEIKNHLIEKFNINSNKIYVLLNPINKKYHEISCETSDITPSGNYGLFACRDVGVERYGAVLDFAIFCRELNYKPILISYLHPHVRETLEKFYDIILDPTPDLHLYVKNAKICGGILKGRTYWESKLYGKPVLEYMVNASGEIIEELYESAPKHTEIEEIKKITNPDYLANKIIEISKVNEDYVLDDYFSRIYNLNKEYNILENELMDPIKIEIEQNNNFIDINNLEINLDFLNIITKATLHKHEHILIIQKNAIISKDINKIFSNKYKKLDNDWEIIIFSSDYSGIAMKEHVYLELKNKLNFNTLVHICITELIEKYKTYIFKDKLIYSI